MIAFLVNRRVGLINLALRGSSLALRLALSFYIVKYLGLEAAGVYGLSLGLVGVAPVIASGGVNYYLVRDIVGNTREAALVKVKTRLLMSTAITALLVGALALAALLAGYPLRPIHGLVAAVVWLEIYANDIHVALIGLERPLAANVLVAIRLALWVPFVILAGMVLPALRDIDVIFAGWLASYVVYAAALRHVLREWPLGRWGEFRIDGVWLKDRLRRSWMILISDVGMVGLNYVDRYIVSLMLGITLTGLYTFYWSLTTALQTLIGTAIVQVALPTLYRAHGDRDHVRWRAEMRSYLARVLGYSLVIGAAIFGLTEILIAFGGMSELAGNRGVFAMLLLAAILRSVGELLNTALMSMHKDVEYTVLNIGSLVLSIAVASAMIGLFGFAGTGIAALASAAIVVAARTAIIRRSAPGAG